MLQARGERAVGHLDAVELEVLVVVRAGDAEGAQQRAALDLEPDHHEVAVAEAQARVAGGREAEQGVVPVVDAQDALFAEVLMVLQREF